MSSDTIRTNTVHLLSSKTYSTHLLFIDMQHIVRWKHGRRDRFCNSFRRYITGRRKFGIAEALQLKHFSLNGHLNNSIVRTMSECKHDEYGSRGKIGFPALEIFGLRLDWEVREIFIWCQQQPSQVPTDIRRTNAVNEMGFSYRILRFITYTMAYRSAYQNMAILQTLLSRLCTRKNTPFLE